MSTRQWRLLRGECIIIAGTEKMKWYQTPRKHVFDTIPLSPFKVPPTSCGTCSPHGCASTAHCQCGPPGTYMSSLQIKSNHILLVTYTWLADVNVSVVEMLVRLVPAVH